MSFFQFCNWMLTELCLCLHVRTRTIKSGNSSKTCRTNSWRVVLQRRPKYVWLCHFGIEQFVTMKGDWQSGVMWWHIIRCVHKPRRIEKTLVHGKWVAWVYNWGVRVELWGFRGRPPGHRVSLPEAEKLLLFAPPIEAAILSYFLWTYKLGEMDGMHWWRFVGFD